MTISFPLPLIVFSLALTASHSLAIQASESKEHWIADSHGCKVAASSPKVRDAVVWSGACVDGYAKGIGQLQWLHRGKAHGHYAGALHAGKPDGHGVYEYPNGDRYEGDFVDGASTRSGVLKLIDGRPFATDLVTGQTPSMARFVVPSVLSVVCFAEDGRIDSLDLVRSSGVTLYDHVVLSIVKTKAAAGEDLVRAPFPGCHMVGVGIGQGEYVVFHNNVAGVSAEDVVIRCRRGCAEDKTPGYLP